MTGSGPCLLAVGIERTRQGDIVALSMPWHYLPKGTA